MLYEFFRKTYETYSCVQINYFKINKSLIIKNNINVDIPYFKHMLEQIFLNFSIKLNMNFIGDIKIDYHHSVEDIGIILGKILKFFIPLKKKLYINRYGFFYIPLDDALSRVVVDLCGRSYLSYNVFYYNLYIKNFNVNLFYDFFLSLSNNSNITIYVDNLSGFNIHHIFETIFKSLGRALKMALFFNSNINSSKGIIF